jgi:cardiolipin synthase
MHFFRNVNQRNHHKFCIIDERHLWTGSFNISMEHLSPSNGGNGWHDYGVHITDNKLQPIITSFNHLFENSALNNKKLYLQKIRSNINATLRRISNNLIVRKISHAQHRIWICSAYFSPSYKVLKAIKTARKNGVDICIILPALSDIFFMPWLSRTYYKKLIRQGVKIYEYQPSVLHAKLLLIDDHCLIGSTNLNHRSFHHDLELDIVLSKPETIKRIEQWLLADMKLSRAISLTDISQQAIPLFFARFLRLFRYWL